MILASRLNLQMLLIYIILLKAKLYKKLFNQKSFYFVEKKTEAQED